MTILFSFFTAAPTYVPQPIMLNALDQNMAALTQVLDLYNVRLAEVQRGQKLSSGAATTHPTIVIIISLAMFIVNLFYV